jgi:hypothetical protein
MRSLVDIQQEVLFARDAGGAASWPRESRGLVPHLVLGRSAKHNAWACGCKPLLGGRRLRRDGRGADSLAVSSPLKAAAIVAACLVACAESPREELIGTWRSSREETLANVER